MPTDEETQKAVEATRNRRREVFNTTVKKLSKGRTEKAEAKQSKTAKDG